MALSSVSHYFGIPKYTGNHPLVKQLFYNARVRLNPHNGDAREIIRLARRIFATLDTERNSEGEVYKRFYPELDKDTEALVCDKPLFGRSERVVNKKMEALFQRALFREDYLRCLEVFTRPDQLRLLPPHFVYNGMWQINEKLEYFLSPSEKWESPSMPLEFEVSDSLEFEELARLPSSGSTASISDSEGGDPELPDLEDPAREELMALEERIDQSKDLESQLNLLKEIEMFYASADRDLHGGQAMHLSQLMVRLCGVMGRPPKAFLAILCYFPESFSSKIAEDLLPKEIRQKMHAILDMPLDSSELSGVIECLVSELADKSLKKPVDAYRIVANLIMLYVTAEDDSASFIMKLHPALILYTDWVMQQREKITNEKERPYWEAHRRFVLALSYSDKYGPAEDRETLGFLIANLRTPLEGEPIGKGPSSVLSALQKIKKETNCRLADICF